MDSGEYIKIAEKYIDTVYRAAYSYCKNKEDAEDAVQNVFMKLMTADTEFTDDEHIKRWLIRCVINECKNNYGSFWHRNKVSLEDMTTEPSYSDKTEQTSEIMTAVMKLPKNYSTVIHLYYYEGYDVKEISGIMGISESNVQIRLMRARNKLKTILKEA